MRGLKLSAWVGLCCLSASFAPAVADSPSGAVPDPVIGALQVPALRKNRDFWVRIYTQYGTKQGLLHDAKYIDRIYEVVELDKSHSVRALKKKWAEVLLSLQRKQALSGGANEVLLTDDEKHVYSLFADVSEPGKFVTAAHRKRMRFQQGAKERFREGLIDSGRYLPIMEEIFRREGIPVELTRLPFVESSFNVKVRSKVGASGIWQFMRSTGRLFLKIDDAVDERNDPIRATEAAAKLLKLNFESLRQWPLAVTAYNHGRKGMMRAVRLVGSESLEDVVSLYRSRTFGFASSNFFCELLAAIEVEKNSEKYFGKLERARPLRFYEVKIPDFIDLRNLVRFMGLDPGVLKEYNPGLTDLVYSGVRLVPAGYRLRLPFDGNGTAEAAERIFLAGYSEIPSIYKHRSQNRGNRPLKFRTNRR